MKEGAFNLMNAPAGCVGNCFSLGRVYKKIAIPVHAFLENGYVLKQNAVLGVLSWEIPIILLLMEDIMTLWENASII